MIDLEALSKLEKRHRDNPRGSLGYASARAPYRMAATNALPELIAELRAARSVVEAARDYQTGAYDLSLGRVWDALAAYDAAVGGKA